VKNYLSIITGIGITGKEFGLTRGVDGRGSNWQEATGKRQKTKDNKQLATDNKQLGTDNKQQTTDNKQLTTGNK
jgi:hypothetical protein